MPKIIPSLFILSNVVPLPILLLSHPSETIPHQVSTVPSLYFPSFHTFENQHHTYPLSSPSQCHHHPVASSPLDPCPSAITTSNLSTSLFLPSLSLSLSLPLSPRRAHNPGDHKPVWVLQETLWTFPESLSCPGSGGQGADRINSNTAIDLGRGERLQGEARSGLGLGRCLSWGLFFLLFRA